MRRRNRKHQSLVLGSMPLVLLGFLIAMLDLANITSATGIMTAAMSIPHVNLPPKNVAEKNTPVDPTALFIQNTWPNGYPHDIDTWVQCRSVMFGQPEHVFTVGYRQRSSGWIDLQRDDLGLPSIINAERVQSNSQVTRVPPNTVCRVNSHLYHSQAGVLPVRGKLLVIVNKDSPSNEILIADLHYELRHAGEEKTLLVVVWDENGNILRDGVQVYPTVFTEKIATKAYTSSR